MSENRHENEGGVMNDRIELLESALKVIRAWARSGNMDARKVQKLCDNVLLKLIHEMPNVRRNRLVDLGG